MPRFRIRLLGPYSVLLDGREIPLPYAKLEALLAFLVMEGRTPLPRDRLAGLLWPDQSDREAGTSLRQALSRLRLLLRDRDAGAPFLLADRRTVQMNPKRQAWVDAWEFESALDRVSGHRHRHPKACPDCAALRKVACDLYRGDFLADLSVPDSDLFDAWRVPLRERLRSRGVSALADMVSWSERREEDSTTRAIVSRLLEVDPWNEGAHSCQLRLLVRAGQRTEAVRHFREASRRLREDLGVEPSQELAAQAEKLVNLPEAEDRDEPRITGLPIAVEPLVGRANELSRLSGMLNDPDQRLITITGPGGVGKTRLAIAVAQAEGPAFDAGVRFIRLDHAHPEWHRALAPDARDKDLLLVLDGFDHVPTDRVQVQRMLHENAKLVVLVTSRLALGIPGESVFRLEGLATPPEGGGQEIERYEAALLFLDGVRRLSGDLRVGPDDHAAIGQICRLVGGLPLALNLAAAWITTLSCREIAVEIRRGLDILAPPGSARDAPGSVRAVFGQSLQLLTEAERRAFPRLSVFRTGFDREAAFRVAGATLEVLAGLVGKSFLSRSSGERFHLHDLARQYGQELLSAAEETDPIMQLLVQYYLDACDARRPDARAAGSFPSFHWLIAEQPNLREALAWATQHQLPAAKGLAGYIREELHGGGTHRWTEDGTLTRYH